MRGSHYSLSFIIVRELIFRFGYLCSVQQAQLPQKRSRSISEREVESRRNKIRKVNVEEDKKKNIVRNTNAIEAISKRAIEERKKANDLKIASIQNAIDVNEHVLNSKKPRASKKNSDQDELNERQTRFAREAAARREENKKAEARTAEAKKAEALAAKAKQAEGLGIIADKDEERRMSSIQQLPLDLERQHECE